MLAVADRTGALVRVLRIAVRVSPFEHGFTARTPTVFNAELLYARIIQTASSILRLATPDDESDLPHRVDAASIASLTRNLLEGYDQFWYLCIEKVQPDERRFRELVAELHHETERQDIYVCFGLDPAGPFGVAGIARPFIIRKLAENPIYRSLGEKQKQDLLRGKRSVAGFHANPRKSRLGPDVLRGLHKWCSNHTHSQPFSRGAEFFDSQLSGEQLVRMCLEASAQHVACAVREFLSLLRRYSHFLTADEKSFVRRLAVSKAPRPPSDAEYAEMMSRWRGGVTP